jgi:uncharacterized protein YndB with AHSA1/START domain
VAITTHVIDAPPQRVFDVLADGWTYSDWVVGTAHIRDVDARWPEVGAQLHHRAGPWPVSVQDRTDILACEPPTSLVMRPHLWPLGAAIVHLRLTPVGDRSTKVEMWEDFEAGPLRWVRTRINDLALHYRNQESLRRLADLATRRR